MYNIQKTWLVFFVAAQLALIFAHTEKYPDEPPLLNVNRSVFNYYYIIIVYLSNLRKCSAYIFTSFIVY